MFISIKCETKKRSEIHASSKSYLHTQKSLPSMTLKGCKTNYPPRDGCAGWTFACKVLIRSIVDSKVFVRVFCNSFVWWFCPDDICNVFSSFKFHGKVRKNSSSRNNGTSTLLFKKVQQSYMQRVKRNRPTFRRCSGFFTKKLLTSDWRLNPIDVFIYWWHIRILTSFSYFFIPQK